MTKFSIQSQHLVGFAAENTKPGQEKAQVIVKNKMITSDDLMFHIYLKHISSLFFSKIKIPVSLIHKFLIVLHNDDKADIYINDFNEIAKVKLKQAVEAGQAVFRHNLSDITDLVFPDISLQKEDVVIYCLRTDWRFSLYFDFGRHIEMEILTKELGELKKEAEFHSLMDSARDYEKNQISGSDTLVFTEGKSDWKHLNRAATKLGINEDLAFFDDDKDRGDTELLRICEITSKTPHAGKIIFIFDRDNEKILKKLEEMEGPDKRYQAWGNNVYSMYLPIPAHRNDNDFEISIEFFYRDSALLAKDGAGRRIYLSNEFNKKSGQHLSEPINCLEMNRIHRDKICIIDSNVFDTTGRSIALSKDDFANNILLQNNGFDEFDFVNFKPIFEIIEMVIKS